MNEFEELIKRLNLAFTNTIQQDEYFKVGFALKYEKINYDKCVSLYEFIEIFTTLHKKFQNEFSKLGKLDLGKNIEILSVDKFYDKREECRFAKLSLEESPLIKEPNSYLYLRELNGKMKSFVINDCVLLDKDFYREDILLDEDISRSYLDLFEKYRTFIYYYNYLKYGENLGDQEHSLIISTSDEDKSILEKLKSLNIYIGENNNHGSTSNITIFLNFDDGMKVDLRNSKLILNDNTITASEDLYTKILNDIYIDKDILMNPHLDRKKSNSFLELLDMYNNLEKGQQLIKKI